MHTFLLYQHETTQHKLFHFTKIPIAGEENGIVAYFLQFGIVGMIYVNDEELLKSNCVQFNFIFTVQNFYDFRIIIWKF